MGGSREAIYSDDNHLTLAEIVPNLGIDGRTSPRSVPRDSHLVLSLPLQLTTTANSYYTMAHEGVQNALWASGTGAQYSISPSAVKTLKDILNNIQNEAGDVPDTDGRPPNNALLVLLPLLIVLSTFLFMLLFFLVCVILIRRRRGIVLRDSDGPVDMSREDLVEGEGGFEGVESRWLESVSEPVRRSYLRAKGRF